MAKTGRPKKHIDQHQFEQLCALQCTLAEICGFFDVTDKTMEQWCRDTYGDTFSVVFKKKREMGKISLRRHQFKLAEKNSNMAIFLGKNYLGQSDNETHFDNSSDAEITVTFVDNSGGEDE